MADLAGKKIGFAICASFCTFEKAFAQIEKLIGRGADVTPIMSFNSCRIDTRFGKACDHVAYLETICGKKVISSIEDAEPIGPKKMFDILVVAPCTGNTLGKLANGITDTPVTMAVKSHLRNQKPVVIAVSTNDALAGSAKNIGMLLNYKNYYFVPMSQDDCINKPTSLVANYALIPDTLILALDGKQLEPVFI